MVFESVRIIVQVVGESFPISSSGHVVLWDHFFSDCYSSAVLSAWHADYILHIPTLIVIALFFRHQWVPLLNLYRMRHVIGRLLLQGFVLELVTCLFWLLWTCVPRDAVMPLWIGFFITAGALWALRGRPEGHRVWSVRDSVVLGALQGIALLPGISRFGITYVGARWLGISVRRSFQISFLIEWPLALAGVGYSLATHPPGYITGSLVLVIAVGAVGAYAGLVLVRWLVYRRYLWTLSLYLLSISVVSFFLF